MWSKLDKEIIKETIEKFKHEPMLLVVDDTQLPRKGKRFHLSSRHMIIARISFKMLR
ncbi:MAG: transposase [Candidatus Parvarchaeota archaeon]|nr:transposase [Candidatus Jingweiarchaeum tengchongense]